MTERLTPETSTVPDPEIFVDDLDELPGIPRHIVVPRFMFRPAVRPPSIVPTLRSAAAAPDEPSPRLWARAGKPARILVLTVQALQAVLLAHDDQRGPAERSARGDPVPCRAYGDAARAPARSVTDCTVFRAATFTSRTA